MPAYSIARKYKKREADYVPPPSTYEQRCMTITEDVEGYRKVGERNLYLKQQRKRWKEEHKKKMEEFRKQKEEKEEEEPVKGETVTYQITESRTRSEKVDAKAQPEKKTLSYDVKQKKILKKTQPPGPGDYNLPSFLNVAPKRDPSKHMEKTSAKLTISKVTPGPDSYSLPSSFGGSAFSIGLRFDGIPFNHPELKNRRQLTVKQYSQPEFRNLPTTIGKSAGVKMNPLDTRSTNEKLLNRTCPAGPGSHDPKLPYSSSAFTIVGRKPEPKLLTNVPGPGEYDSDKVIGYLHPALAKSFSSSAAELKQGVPTDGPGPGAYNPRMLMRVTGPRISQPVERKILSERSIKISEPKPELSKSSSQQNEMAQRETFGRGQRMNFVPKFLTPAPGAYHKETETEWEKSKESTTDSGKDSCTFGIKASKWLVANANPGPGSYLYSFNHANGPYYSVGKGPRAPQENPTYTDMYYDPAPEPIPSSKISIGNEIKQTRLKKSKFPGPGTYSIPGTVGLIPRYLLSSVNI